MVYVHNKAMPTINMKTIKERALLDKNKRKKTSVYLNQTVYKNFIAKCKKQGTSGSKVMEQFMEEYTKES